MLDRSSPGAGAIPEWTGRPSARLPDGLENCPKSRSAVRRVDQAAASRTLPSLRSCCCPPVHQLHFARLQAHRQIVACFLAPTRAGRGRGRVGQQHHRSAGGNSVAGHDPGHTVAGVEHQGTGLYAGCYGHRRRLRTHMLRHNPAQRGGFIYRAGHHHAGIRHHHRSVSVLPGGGCSAGYPDLGHHVDAGSKRHPHCLVACCLPGHRHYGGLFAINFFGDALRDVLDPRLRGR